MQDPGTIEDRETARKVFTEADQLWFAQVSGDANPIHVDPVYARRVNIGVVVHGIHALFWALNEFASRLPSNREINSLEVSFREPIVIGNEVTLSISAPDASRFRLRASVDGALAFSVSERGDLPSHMEAPSIAGQLMDPSTPLTQNLNSISKLGPVRVSKPIDLRALSERYPHAVESIGLGAVAGLCQATFMVGMVCPGLNSLFAGLSVRLNHREERDCPTFTVKRVDEEFRAIRIEVAGRAVHGHLDTFLRYPPVEQIAYESLAAKYRSKRLEGRLALVVGGSRGLGELTAKLLAAAGAEVCITYARGKNDAERVCSEIRRGGGRCAIEALDVTADNWQLPPEINLSRLRSVYMYASPRIYKRNTERFDVSLFNKYVNYYVRALDRLYALLKDRRECDVRIFYPSTSFITDRPKRMTEYAMAKAAGELLAADLNLGNRNLQILTVRLPKLITDQTTSFGALDADDPLPVIYEVVSEVEAASAMR